MRILPSLISLHPFRFKLVEERPQLIVAAQLDSRAAVKLPRAFVDVLADGLALPQQRDGLVQRLLTAAKRTGS